MCEISLKYRVNKLMKVCHQSVHVMVVYVLVFEAGSLKSVLGCQFSSSGGDPAHEALRTLESIETVGVAGRGLLAY